MTTTKTITSVDELKELVGQEVGVGQWLEITQDRVNAFADITGDHQFIHVDPERAAKTPLGGPVAHGFLTLSLLPMLSREREGVKVSLNPKMALNYGTNKVRFISPVHVGKRIRLRSKLLSVDEVAPNTYHTIYQHTVEIEGEEKPAMVAEMIGRMYL